MPEMRIEKIGYGLGTRDASTRPNALRALVGDRKEVAAGETDEITQIETNLDDLSPELAAAAMERLFSAGALDVFFTPAQMKKNRPGFVVTVLCPNEKSSELARILLTETTAFGVRMHRAQRLKLRREFHRTRNALRDSARQAWFSRRRTGPDAFPNTRRALKLPKVPASASRMSMSPPRSEAAKASEACALSHQDFALVDFSGRCIC